MSKRSKSGVWRLPHGLVLLHEDRDILVVDKPSGLLTMGTETDKTRTAYFIMTDYVRKGAARSRNRIFIVHRLDRETSGVLVFAKNEDAKFRLQDAWETVRKEYLAIVHGHPQPPADTITSYLAENDGYKVYSTNNPRSGKLSHTAYTVIREARDYSLLKIDLLTGRKNQIRVHLADIGHSVVGDSKYGRAKDGHKSLALHAHSITLHHPFSGQELHFAAKPPSHFNALIDAGDY